MDPICFRSSNDRLFRSAGIHCPADLNARSLADAPPWLTHVTGRGNGTNPAASTAFFSTAMSQPKRLQPRCPPPRCLKHGLFSRGVLHHGVFIRGVFKHGAVIPALVIPAPLAFPSTARLAGWQDRLAEPSHGIGFRLPPNRCHLDAAPIPPGAIEIMAFNWLHDSRPFNPGRHGRSRAQRAGMALGNGSRKWLPGTAPGNSSVSRATQSTSRRSASPSFVSPRSMPPRSILPCSKPPCSTSPPLLAVSGVIGPNVPASSNSPESFPATPWPSVRPVPPSPRRHVAERRGSPRLREDRPGRDFDTA